MRDAGVRRPRRRGLRRGGRDDRGPGVVAAALLRASPGGAVLVGYGCWTAASAPGRRPGSRSARRGYGARSQATSRPSLASCRSWTRPVPLRSPDPGILLDARAPARYRGETEPARPGRRAHPGRAERADGGERHFSRALPGSRPQLRAQVREPRHRSRAAGRPQVGAYCGSGVTAAHEVLALELAGIPAALYVGSWSGWIADPARPVATGPQPGRGA